MEQEGSMAPSRSANGEPRWSNEVLGNEVLCTAWAPFDPRTRPSPIPCSLYPAFKSGHTGQSRSLGQVHRHQSADARLAHGHARQLSRRFHRRLVMGDEEELYLFAHLVDHLRKASDVGF